MPLPALLQNCLL
ncbi:unnamed protein product [Acanthoscelides obtectus]|uniref:Uncharacterized protein n=1 Tax=Acanthoscelides obtectus TaxID=200917 RepID=A0A9P0QC47_ACAOB|nr:unnamed protein product [Acanthoscelides obtectus]CAH2016830.1 unnamed protein product [Acanthoscelides obtectus]CAK1667881.1 hypothetical protein AOBTE_LOCUS26086 [Acanthoscelides obtectus]CAK1667893.1 hypothetical protein AOBTE_LOCUS26094 [Acanthoscelides obtectus]